MRDLDPQDLQTLEELYGIKPQKPPRKKWYIPAILIVLIVACVGGAELLACRHFEPALYEEIAAPARRIAQTAWDGICRAGSAAAGKAGEVAAALSDQVDSARDSLNAWLEDLAALPPEPEPDSILAQPEITPPRELLDPLISDIVERDGQEYITGGGIDVVYYNQTDEARSGQKYGSDPLSTHGCGPTAMAMAVSSLTEELVDPEDMAQLCVKQGYWSRGHGSCHAIVPGVAESFGLNCKAADLTALEEDELYSRLSTGEIAVALMTKGHFTKGGHFILLRGVTLSGEILVADPASRDRSLIPWDLSLILGELSPSRNDGAPLWFLSSPPTPEQTALLNTLQLDRNQPSTEEAEAIATALSDNYRASHALQGILEKAGFTLRLAPTCNYAALTDALNQAETYLKDRAHELKNFTTWRNAHPWFRLFFGEGWEDTVYGPNAELLDGNKQTTPQVEPVDDPAQAGEHDPAQVVELEDDPDNAARAGPKTIGRTVMPVTV